MTRNHLPRNAACPCGSGKKYKNCCSKKGFEWLVDEDGTFSRSIPMSEDMAQLLGQQRQRFVEQFGREPGPDDNVFFDAPPLEHLEHEMVQAMKKIGVDPAIIYAFEQTGLIVTEDNQHLLPDTDLAEWEAAVQEYRTKHGDAASDEDEPNEWF